MQTFLPFDNFDKVAKHLDWIRLGKQRVEAKQILYCLEQPNRWIHHPAVQMWKGHKSALTEYMNAMIREWVVRGYKNNMPIIKVHTLVPEKPKWIGDPEIHRSHRMMLVWKSINDFLEKGKRVNFDWYKQFGWAEEYIGNLDSFTGYIWPVEIKDYKPKKRLEIPEELWN